MQKYWRGQGGGSLQCQGKNPGLLLNEGLVTVSEGSKVKYDQKGFNEDLAGVL